MAAPVLAAVGLLKHKLQELFAPSEERLVGIIGVNKPGKKKKLSYLVVTVTVKQPQAVFLHRVKPFEGGKKGEHYKKAKTWNLSELKLVDGKSTQMEDSTFSLHLERNYKWTASTSGEKEAFIACLWRQTQKFPIYNGTGFTNVDKERLKELTHLAPSGSLLARSGREPSEEAADEYQELLPKEEEDLQEVLASHENAIQDSERLMEKLSEELSTLDEASIETIIESEDQVRALMDKVDEALVEVGLIEQNLNEYAFMLNSVRSATEKTDSQFRHVMVEDRNLFELKEALADLVMKLDLDEGLCRTLMSTPLKKYNVEQVTTAALRLQEAQAEDMGHLKHLSAVKEQRKRFSDITKSFCSRLEDHLLKVFQEHSNVAIEAVAQRCQRGGIQDLSLPVLTPHRSLHEDLRPYGPLMNWLKEVNAETFDKLCQHYCTIFSKVYDAEVRDFISDLKQRVAPKKGGSKLDESSFSLTVSALNVGRSVGSLPRSASKTSVGSGTGEEGENPTLFFQVFAHVLEQLEPLCATEQEFCIAFFNFTEQDEMMGAVTMEDEVDAAQTDGSIASKKAPVPMVNLSKVLSDGLKAVLANVFQVLLPQMEQLMQFGERLDNFNTLYMMIYISRRWLTMKDDKVDATYLDNTLFNTLPYVRRLFEKFLASRITEVNESKPSKKKTKCGVLPCVVIFARFAERAEQSMQQGDRRIELDRAYKQLMEAVTKAIERCALEHPRTPPDVIRFENYHHLFDVLSKMKIPGMEGSREEAKRNYKRYIEQYCIASLGRPLEKLSLFFDGVEALIAANTRPDEVCYRMDFSKTVLRECIQKYSGKEVKKGVEKLYKKVEKDVSDEEGLLTVVWGHMQEAFINQVRHFESLIKQCYQDSNIALLFSVKDLQEFFESVAKRDFAAPSH